MMLIVDGKDAPAAPSSAINAAKNGEAASAFDGTSTLYYTQLAALTRLQTNTTTMTTTIKMMKIRRMWRWMKQQGSARGGE